jgi:hypothetical protein
MAMGAMAAKRSMLSFVFSVPGIATIIWLEFALAAIFSGSMHSGALSLEADDAMRLVQVRDLLAGQSWFDLTQYRMSPPAGVAMHWTRLVDTPLAGLILFFRLFTNSAAAEALAVSVWPVFLALPVWLALGRIATRLSDREAGVAALLLALTCRYALGYFLPGEIDHHNAQLALTVLSLALLLDFNESARFAVACAALTVLSLGIGLETLPYVAMTCATVAAFWIGQGGEISRSVRAFGFTFAAVALGLTFGVVADHERYSMACDTFSGIYEILAVVGGTGVAAITFVPALCTSRTRRALAVAALAIVLLAILLLMAPQCANGPYAEISPELGRVWLSQIEEAQSPLLTASIEIGFFFATYVYALVGFAASVAAIFLVERQNRRAAIVVCAFAAAALTVATWELRGAGFAILAGLPGIAVTIRQLALRWIRPGLWRAAAIIVALLAASDLAFAYFGIYILEGPAHVEQRTLARAAGVECIGKDATTQLAALPRGQVADLLYAAPAILLYTNDTVMAGSYRDFDAILDTYALFTGPPNAGAAILRKHQVDYIATCRLGGAYTYYIKAGGPGGLLSQLDKGHVPPWLTPLPPSGPKHQVQIYKVLRDRLPKAVSSQP